nr:S8 family serine peptidase [candidate division Zixibacteria bacterium]
MLSEKAREYLNNQTGEKVKIWVFYNDKGVFNSQDFDRAARKIEINDKAAQRRAKMGLNEVVFADLPVVQDYIDRITDIGGRMLRASRWLNAAAFEIDREKINLIPEFSFVNKIVPVAQYISPAPSEMEESPVPPEDLKISPTDTDALDYGTSYNQVQMINVPAMHNLGYNGSGVVVAMLDTGYRKSHNAFDSAFADNRVLAEYDFIFDDSETQNETEDNASQHNHGTYCWSTLGGYAPGYVIGPAYDASFLLAKTEDVRSETIVEEYNWVAGMEWADSLGADVISTSLGYSEWYSYEDFDGNTAVTTVAANTAAGLGIIICNSAGNEGPSAGTLSAPADAFDILACGAVDQYESIASFSSRGPTYDGRTKPEVCAMGVSTHCADGAGNNFYTIKNGTSLSTPLVGGAAALLLSANPTLTPWQVRAAFMETANNAASPDNTYGWGVINVLDAFNWGANFTIDTAFGWDDLTVNFTDSSTPPATSWKWHFGDGDSSEIQNPSHTYSTPGSYDVTLVIESSEGALTRLKKDLIVVLADTLTFAETAGFAGETAIMSVNLTNSQELNRIVLPVKYPASMEVILDSISAGTRTIDFEATNELYRDNDAHQLVYELIADNGGGTGELQPGTGEIARLFFAVGGTAEAGDYAGVNAIEINGYELDISNSRINYTPAVNAGQLVVQSTMRGDADNSGGINILDVTYIVNYLYRGGPAPLTIRAGDADSSGGINILDATYLIAYLYRGGPPPAE